ncbi:hypothetical protein [Methylomonas albis]|nr:hypothetical protein [Methylomonas albis]
MIEKLKHLGYSVRFQGYHPKTATASILMNLFVKKEQKTIKNVPYLSLSIVSAIAS